MGEKGIVVAIDGPAGSGKSTTARLVARRLGYLFLDTGAMYRCLAMAVLRAGIDLEDGAEAAACARGARIGFTSDGDAQRVLLDDEDVTDLVRSAEVSEAASRVAVHPDVRQVLVARQRDIGREGGIVAEGRDTGTAVFPEAELKVFLDAAVEMRARRRQKEMSAGGGAPGLSILMEQIRERDARDRATQARLGAWPAQDAVRLDTTDLSVADQVAQVVALAVERGARP